MKHLVKSNVCLGYSPGLDFLIKDLPSVLIRCVVLSNTTDFIWIQRYTIYSSNTPDKFGLNMYTVAWS